MSFVYVIQAEGGPVKVGVAANPDKRLAALRTGTPFPLSLAHVEPIADDLCAAAVERAAHALLRTAHAHGEWFTVSPHKARDAIQSAITHLRNAPPELVTSVAARAVTAGQVRAARGFLAWSQRDLATRAGVGLSTVADFERGIRTPIKNNLAAIEQALEEAGIEFVNDDILSVSLRS